jgi:4'-phosphopantetheinyl transferase
LEILSQLTHAESERILSASPEQRIQSLYRVWTRKEAVLKASGEGLGIELNQFEVPAATDRYWQIRFNDRTWYAADLEGLAEFAGCLVLSLPITALCERRIAGLSASLTGDLSHYPNRPVM